MVPQTRMGVEFVIRQAFFRSEGICRKVGLLTTKIKWSKGWRGLLLPIVFVCKPYDILTEKIILHCHSYRADEIR